LALEYIRKAAAGALKILSILLGCHQEMLLNLMRRRRPFGLECQLEMTDDSVDGFRFFDNSYLNQASISLASSTSAIPGSAS
jgi:hypothetical protein